MRTLRELRAALNVATAKEVLIQRSGALKSVMGAETESDTYVAKSIHQTISLVPQELALLREAGAVVKIGRPGADARADGAGGSAVEPSHVPPLDDDPWPSAALFCRV